MSYISKALTVVEENMNNSFVNKKESGKGVYKTNVTCLAYKKEITLQ